MSVPAWHPETVAGRRVDVYVPDGLTPVAAVLFLHDLDGHIPSITPLLGELGIAALAPHGGPCWWADRTCPAFDPTRTPERWLLDEVLPFAAARSWPVGGLVGVGMGGQGALRLAFRHPKMFPAVAAVNAAVDLHDFYGRGTPLDQMFDSREQCRQDSAVLHIHPAQQPPHIFFVADPGDPRWRGNDRLHEKLSALGVAHECDLTTGADGASESYLNRQLERAVRFVHGGLVREARRLL